MTEISLNYKRSLKRAFSPKDFARQTILWTQKKFVYTSAYFDRQTCYIQSKRKTRYAFVMTISFRV